MSQRPAFNVRDYPSFRPARLYRVLFSTAGIDFIRMRGLVGQADAGAESFLNGQQAAIADFIRNWASKSIAVGVSQVDAAEPEALLRSSKKNFRVAPEDFTVSSLEPPAVFGGHGLHYARWKFALKDGRKLTLQTETPEDLKAAIALLPEFLGSNHATKVAWNEVEEGVVRVH